MAKKSTSLVFLVLGIVIATVGFVMSFFNLKNEPSWYEYLWKGLIGVGIVIIIVGAILVEGIKEVKTTIPKVKHA